MQPSRPDHVAAEHLFRCIVCQQCYPVASRCHTRQSGGLAVSNQDTCRPCCARVSLVKKSYHENASLLFSPSLPQSQAASLSPDLPRHSRELQLAMGSSSYFTRSFTPPSVLQPPAPPPASIPSQLPPAASPDTKPSTTVSLPQMVECSFPGCPAKTPAGQVLCQHHLESLFSRPKGPNDPLPPRSMNSTRSTPARAGSVVVAAPHRNKLLAENDKDRPITRRKTDTKLPPQPHRRTTPSSSADSRPSPISPQAVVAPPVIHSPPTSPDSPGNGQPARKRLRISPSQGGPATSNGVINANVASADLRSSAEGLQSQRHGLDQSFQQPARLQESGGGNPDRFNWRDPVRKIAPPASLVQKITTRPSSSEKTIDGPAGSAGQVDGQNPDHAGRFVPSQSWTIPKSHQSPSLARVDLPRDVPCKAMRISSLVDEHAEEAKRALEHPYPWAGMRGSSESTQRNSICTTASPAESTSQSLSSPPDDTPQKLPNRISRPQLKAPQQPKAAVNEALFDSLVYRQEGTASPPPELMLVDLPTKTPTANTSDRTEKPIPPDEPLYAEIDPRIHWPQPHSAAWHAAKQAEIKARGNRKANFGKAAQRMRQHQQPATFEETLPEKIRDNAAWVRMLRRLKTGKDDEAGSREGLAVGNSSGSGAGAEAKTQQPEKKKGKPGPKPKNQSAGSTPATTGSGTVSTSR